VNGGRDILHICAVNKYGGRTWLGNYSRGGGILFASNDSYMIHPTAEVSDLAQIGVGTKVWARSHIREGAQIGKYCIVGEGVYIDVNVVLGDNVKVQNGALIYHGVVIEDGAFVGPHVSFTNDLFPRSVTLEGKLRRDGDWEVGCTRVGRGASLGAGAIVLTNLVIGEWALVGAGAVVTRDVPPYALVIGNPARRIGYVCKCGRRLIQPEIPTRIWVCRRDGSRYMGLPGGGLSDEPFQPK
jgi:UDP-2-acetamido-3-amino-2,3-dideoxy-glucuronate N-acetyltransferase